MILNVWFLDFLYVCYGFLAIPFAWGQIKISIIQSRYHCHHNNIWSKFYRKPSKSRKSLFGYHLEEAFHMHIRILMFLKCVSELYCKNIFILFFGDSRIPPNVVRVRNAIQQRQNVTIYNAHNAVYVQHWTVLIALFLCRRLERDVNMPILLIRNKAEMNCQE